MAEPRPLSSVAIVGGGPVALLAAIAIARALPASRVVLVPCTVPDHALADRIPCGGPALNQLHARIGIAEGLLLARAGASHCLATRYRGWAGGGDFLVGQGAAPRDAAGGFAPGMSLASALADAERFLPPGVPGGDLLDPVLRWDPESYVAGLRMLCRQAGVTTTAPARGAAPGPAIALEDGTELRAELMIDASGDGWLRAAAGDAAWVDWSEQTPVDRLQLPTAPGAARLSLCDTVAPIPGGYTITCPGRNGGLRVAGWSSRATNAEAVARALAAADGDGDGSVGAAVAFAPGRLHRPWHGRVVAIGDAAARFEPLGGLNLHLAASQLLLLLSLLPAGEAPFAETAEFNRRAGLLADHAQDMVVVHHGGAGSPMLAQRCDQFARRGWVPELAEGCVSVDRWAQLLAGLGHGPGTLPRMAAIRARGGGGSGDAAGTVAARDAMPYADWLRQVLGGPPL